MITFYKADETDFDNNGFGVLDHDIQNPDIEEKLNDIFTFSFNYPIFGVNGSRLAARMIVKADDPENEGQLFRIMKLSKSNGMLTAFCYHIFYDLNGNEIPDTNIVGQNGQTAITQMLSKTAVAHKFQGYSDISDIANIRVVRMSPVKFLIDPQTDNNFINRLGGEIRRVNYRIWMNKVRGSDNGATIRWKKSLDSYNATWDYTTIATRIRPVGYNGIMLPESYVDSPLIDKYETIVIKEIQYSDIKAIDPNTTSNDETAVPLEQAYELLRQAAAKEFNENNLDKPTVTLSVNMVALRNMDEYKDVKSLETINPWDTVTVINERDGLSVKVRLNHYHWNPVTRKFISMELGNSKSSFTNIGSKVDHATNLANQANDTANHASASADGKNTIYRDVKHEDIVNPVNGDTCFEKNGDKEEIWIYNGKSVPPSWELIVDDATGEEVRQNVDAAQKEAEEAKKQANKAVDGANDAVAKAGFATDTATQAKSDAASALQKALDAYNHGDQIKTGLTADIDAVKGQVSLKANQVDVDKLGGRVTDAEAQIKLQADQIKLTVSKTELTNVLGEYATQTWTQSQIKSTADSINLSVSKVQSNLDNLAIGGRNYIRKSYTVYEYAGNGGANQTSNSWNFTFGNISNMPFNDNDPMVFAVDYSCLGSGSGGTAAIQYNQKPWGITGSASVPLAEHGTLHAYGTFNSVIKQGAATGIMVRTDGMAETKTLTISNARMYRATKDPGWQMAPEDQIDDTQFSNLQVTINGIQGTVQNKAEQSQVTQLANQITSTVTDLSAYNLITNTEFEDRTLNGWGFLNPSLWSVGFNNSDVYMGSNALRFHRASTQTPIGWTDAGSDWIEVYAGQVVSASAVMYQTGSTGDGWTPTGLFVIEIDFYKDKTSGRMEFYQSSAFDLKSPYVKQQLKVENIKVPEGANYARLHVQTNGTGNILIAHPMLVKRATADTYVSGAVSQSQITQLSNDINLRVQKGDVVNQINISPEGILIDGKKVHITGQTSIDNAVIKDAMIADIKADKITAGTLNAANVNVINLNANNITTGTIKGANLSLNLNTGEVLFQHGRIHSASNNVDVNIDQGYLSVADSVNRVLLKGGQMQFVAPNLFDNQTNPYLSISNSGGGQGLFGGQIVGRDFLSLANSANNTGFFDNSLGIETFAGISFGKANGTWRPTKIGGAERGIMLVGGASMPSNMFGDSPSIIIGANENLQTTGNRIVINGEYIHAKSVYEKTSSASANVVVNSDGSIVRSTSASKYKMDILRTNTPDYGEKLLELPTATWMDIAETKRYRDDPVNQIKPTRNFGMIAEDLADAGLEMLVVRGADGELEGINYDRIGPALIPVIAKLKNEVETLKQQLEAETA